MRLMVLLPKIHPRYTTRVYTTVIHSGIPPGYTPLLYTLGIPTMVHPVYTLGIPTMVHPPWYTRIHPGYTHHCTHPGIPLS